MLEANHSRVQNLTGLEIWLFIIARVLIGFGVGILAMSYFPARAVTVGWPAIAVGLVLFVVASKGLVRKR